LEFLAIPTFSSKSDDPLRTAFDNFFDEQMADPAVAEAYHEARSQIDVIDQFVRVMKLAADAISTVPEGRSHAELLVRHFPWVRFLPDEDRSLFERSFVETLLACVSLDNFAKLEELLGDWKATALIHADPELAADLKKLIPDDDQ
jgi:hypothetical protein